MEAVADMLARGAALEAGSGAGGLSVLVVVPEGADPSPWCALAEQTDAVTVVLACPEGRGLPKLRSRCELVLSAQGNSIFHMWGVALRRASGAYVAVVDSRCPPAPTWLEAVRSAIDEGIPAFFGPVSCGSGARGLGSVEYLLEYGQFARPVDHAMTEVPGNNLVFRRKLLDASSLHGEQFHKVFFVEGLRRRGHAPVYRDGMEVLYAKRYGRLQYLSRRFAHGRTYAALRARSEGFGRRVLRSLSSPLLPLLRLYRVARSARGKPGLRAALWLHPLYAAAAETAWSLGEFAGYLTGRPGNPLHLD